MANDFKMVTAENIGTSQVTLYTAPASKTTIILELDIANTATAVVETSVQVTDTSASSTSYLVKNAPIPSGSALQVISGQKVILEAGDIVKVTSSGAVDCVASILEEVN